MADQLIGVLGTLGGTLIGIIGAIIINARSNSHSTKLQKLKNEHDIAIKEQERNRAFLEELCELCFQVQKKVLLAVSDIKDLRELTHLDLSEPTNRMAVIVSLYYDSLAPSYWQFVESVQQVEEAYNIIYNKATRTPIPPGQSLNLRPEIDTFRKKVDEEYSKSFGNFFQEIRKLVK